MIPLRTEGGVMLAGLILSFCIHGCSAYTPGHPSTPEPSEGKTLTPRPASINPQGGINPHEGLTPQKQADQHDRATERY